MSRHVLNKLKPVIQNSVAEPITSGEKKTAIYAFIGIGTWLFKSIRDTIDDYEKRKNMDAQFIIQAPIVNFLYYSPNVVLWPAIFGIDAYVYGVQEFYKYKNMRKKEELERNLQLARLDEPIGSHFAAKNIAKEPEKFGL